MQTKIGKTERNDPAGEGYAVMERMTHDIVCRKLYMIIMYDCICFHLMTSSWVKWVLSSPRGCRWCQSVPKHYTDVIMGAIASQITSLTIVYSIVYSDVDQRKHQSSASLAFVWGIHRGPVTSPHKWPVARKMFPFDDVIMTQQTHQSAKRVHMSWGVL